MSSFKVCRPVSIRTGTWQLQWRQQRAPTSTLGGTCKSPGKVVVPCSQTSDPETPPGKRDSRLLFQDTIRKIPGLTHYYPLDAANRARDVIGQQHGTATGVTFSAAGAVFDGDASINLGHHDDFSLATRGELSIVAFVTISDWHGKGAPAYVHWAGKGAKANVSAEYAFRHYVKGSRDPEAATRQGRCSFYLFDPAGGKGPGSFCQDPSLPTVERVFTAMANLKNTYLAVGGRIRDIDLISSCPIRVQNNGAPLMLGTRGDSTGYLVGTLRRVAFFNRVLNADEIKAIYEARNDQEGPTGAVA